MSSDRTLAELRNAAGLTQTQVSDRLGTQQGQYAMVENGKRPVRDTWAKALAEMFGVSPIDIVVAGQLSRFAGAAAAEEEKRRNHPPRENPSRPPSARIIKAAPPPKPPPSSQIPIRAVARAGTAREAFTADGPIDWTDRPAFLRGGDAYAILVSGTSMMPRFRPGQILFVDPYRPPLPGQGVVIVTYTDAVMIKEFVGYGDDHGEEVVALREYQPEERVFTVFASEVATLHSVVGTRDA